MGWMGSLNKHEIECIAVSRLGLQTYLKAGIANMYEDKVTWKGLR